MTVLGQRRQPIAPAPSAAPSDSSVTFSRIIPGTSQLKRAASTWLSSASGTVSVTPSCGCPGSKRYLSGSVGAAIVERFGKQFLGDVRGRVAHQLLAREEQQRGSLRFASSRQRSKVGRDARRPARAGRRRRGSARRRPARPGGATCARAPRPRAISLRLCGEERRRVAELARRPAPRG